MCDWNKVKSYIYISESHARYSQKFFQVFSFGLHLGNNQTYTLTRT